MIVSGSSESYETPPVGLQGAVCVNWFDIGFQPGMEGKIAHKIVALFELAERKSDGKRFLVTKLYTASLNEKANLRKDLASWRTRDFTSEELAGFELDNTIGKSCQLNLVADTRNGSTYVNVQTVLPAAKGLPAIIPETGRDFIPEWVKKKIAEQLPAPAKNHTGAPPPQSDDFTDDIPF